MENVSYIGLSQQLSLQQQMNMTANNLANMSTPGYRAQQTLFSEYMTQPRGGDVIRQSTNSGSYRDLSVGSLTQTHNPFDVALQDRGYFVVQTPGGLRYTRDGSFTLDANGQLVNKNGYAVMNENNEPIQVQADATQIRITEDGEITSEFGTIGRIKVANVENEQAMTRTGENLFSADDQQEQPVENVRIVQGFTENANVNPVIEMNRMIEILRTYQSAQRMLQNDHERIRNAIQKLTQV
ncbi:MAG: flagellar basal-body rod protein FlgF [Alphaproteobacteria bacterium]|nr:flagellar basal-body rod protein FlgF [Alphaproteobacteria bacterium]